MEPSSPGVCENIINLGDCWDSAVLREYSSEINAVNSVYKGQQKQATACIRAAAAFITDTEQIARRALLPEKIEAFCKSFIKRELKKDVFARIGGEQIRLFSAVTLDGITFFEQSIAALADKIFVVEDKPGAAANIIMNTLRAVFNKEKVAHIAGISPLFPDAQTDQLILPESKIAVVRQNGLLKCEGLEPYRTFHGKRFYDCEVLADSRKKIAFNKKASAELLSAASTAMREAKNTHDILESYYIPAMDFNKTDAIFEKLKNEIFIK